MKFNFQSNKIATVFPFAILLIFLRIDLILLNTLPTGGDMGAHIVPTKFFRKNAHSIRCLQDYN